MESPGRLGFLSISQVNTCPSLSVRTGVRLAHTKGLFCSRLHTTMLVNLADVRHALIHPRRHVHKHAPSLYSLPTTASFTSVICLFMRVWSCAVRLRSLPRYIVCASLISLHLSLSFGMAWQAAFLTAASALFTAVVATPTLHARSFGSSCVEMPTQSESTTAEQHDDDEMARCMAFLDAHRDAWDVESSDVAQLEANTRHGRPTVQVMRLKEEYRCTYDNKHAPFLRIVAFLPQVETSVVYKHVTDPKTRCAWDTNYQQFVAAPKLSTDIEPNLLTHVGRPWHASVRYQRQCLDGVCTRIPDSTCSQIDSQWFVHRLGSAFLSKLGVADRFFAYQRVSTAYRPASPASVCTAFDIVYGGAPDLLRDGKRLSPNIRAFLEDMEMSKGGCKPVQVNYQHIALLPITNVARQLLDDSEKGWKALSEMASVVDTQSCNLFHDCLMESNGLALEHKLEKGLSGTLFIITSANCADVPAFMPRWMQRRVSTLVASNTYEKLQNACIEATTASSSVK